MKIEFSSNDKVTIYPNNSGLDKMVLLIEEIHCITHGEAVEMVSKNLTDGDGYTDQLWCIIQDFGSMFFNGQTYFETTKVVIKS